MAEVVVSSPGRMSTGLQHLGTPRWLWNDTAQWYVIQTKPRQEERLVAHLARRARAAEPFLPKIEVIRRHARRRVVTLEPLFPSYLFLRMTLGPAMWNAVRWAPGTRRILGDGDQPLAVPADLVQMIRDRVEPLGFVRVGLNVPAGVRVRIRTGPFAGLEGIFERPTSRQDRVRVLLEVLGSVRSLEIEIFDLERV